MALACVVRDADGPEPHLIAGQEAFCYHPWQQPHDRSFERLGFDVVNSHPLPGTFVRGRTYDLGAFMSKQLRLRALRDFCLATYEAPKPLNLDEDNAATQYKDPEGWTIHRKRAWTALFCGCHYDMIDFSINAYCETGTPESQRHIRAWMKHLSQFIHSVDIVRARPRADSVLAHPPHIVASVLAVEGEDYCIYLADDREVGEEGAGTAIGGEMALRLVPGEYRVSCYSPTTGLSSPSLRVSAGGPQMSVDLPEFHHDITVRIRRRE